MYITLKNNNLLLFFNMNIVQMHSKQSFADTLNVIVSYDYIALSDQGKLTELANSILK